MIKESNLADTCAVIIIENPATIREKFYYGIPYPLTILPSQPLTYSTTQPKCSHRMHPVKLHLNLKAAKKINVKAPGEILKPADKVYE